MGVLYLRAMSFFTAIEFVWHRQRCKIKFECEKCESDIPFVLGIIADAVLIVAIPLILSGK